MMIPGFFSPPSDGAAAPVVSRRGWGLVGHVGNIAGLGNPLKGKEKRAVDSPV